MSRSVTGRLNARRAIVERICRAHRSFASRQVKIRWRLGDSPGPVTSYGPRNSTLPMAGASVTSPAYS
jgi:hypothetical protein